MNKSTVIEVNGLKTWFFTDDGILKAVDGVRYTIEAGKTFGLIGESGCGKSAASQSILRIVPPPGRIVGGQILFRDVRTPDAETVDLAALNPKGREIRQIRGGKISMIFQEPMTSLSPLHTIENQMVEAIMLHRTRNKREAVEIAYDMLVRVGISNPRQRLKEYPHQLSGGIRQRVMIAMSLSCNPSLLIADEPTTALDVTVQAQVLELIRNLQQELGMAVQYITHDLGVIAEIADTVGVMYLGRIVEMGTLEQIFRHPMHPYTERLMKSIPSLTKEQRRLATIQGNVPIPIDLPVSCGFASRCPMAMKGKCDCARPKLVDSGDGHLVSCFLYSTEAEENDVVVPGQRKGR